MKDSEALKQLAEATELLNMLEHLTAAYSKQQGSQASESSAAYVAWQGLRFNLKECKKRVVSAHNSMRREEEDTRSRSFDRSAASRPLPVKAQAVEAQEQQSSVRTPSSSASMMRELSPLARRIRRAPTNGSKLNASPNDSSSLSLDTPTNGEPVNGALANREPAKRSERGVNGGATLRELRPMNEQDQQESGQIDSEQFDSELSLKTRLAVD